MRIAGLTLMATYFILLMFWGYPLSMSLKGMSWSDSDLVLTTTHETLASLITRSSRITADCPSLHESFCIQTKDSALVRAHFPVYFEPCDSGRELRQCDDVQLTFHFSTKTIILAGVRL